MFEEMIEQLNTQVRSIILENTKDIVSLESQLPLLLTRKQVSELIGVGVNYFDEHYRYASDFPKELAQTKWNKYEVIEYFKRGIK